MQNTYSSNPLLGVILVILFFNVAAEIVDSSVQLDKTTQDFIIQEIERRTDPLGWWREVFNLVAPVAVTIVLGLYGGALFIRKEINKVREEMQQITDEIRDIKARIDRITAEMFQIKNSFKVLKRQFEDLNAFIWLIAIVSFLAFLGVIWIALS